MARPKKATVDYFPHYVNHGKTLFILEQKYGNDGYAFWFKLLEMLGGTDGHYLRLENVPDWEFLQAKTSLSDDKCKEILDLLANLDAIDKELWEKKIVWSDNFLSNIADVYRNRRVEIPSKPSFYEQKPLIEDVSTDENPQSKVKESKVNKIKKNYARYVNLTETEYQKLVDQFGEKLAHEKITTLSLYKESKGKKYSSDYATILSWDRKEKKNLPKQSINKPVLNFED